MNYIKTLPPPPPAPPADTEGPTPFMRWVIMSALFTAAGMFVAFAVFMIVWVTVS